MVNHSSVKQILETDIRNNFDNSFDIDMSSTCTQLSDASQVMRNINVDGSKNVTFEQVNEAHNLCKLQSMAELDILSKLSAETKNALADTLSQSGGIVPGLNNSERDQQILTTIRNDVTTDIMLDQSKECIQKLNQTQRMTEINVGDSMNVRFGQTNRGFNECLGDANAAIVAKVDAAIKAEAKAEGTTDQSGFLGKLGAGGIGLALLSPIISSCCIVVIIVIVMMVGKGDKGDEAVDAMAHCQKYGSGSLAGSECGADPKCSWNEGQRECLPKVVGGGINLLAQYGGVTGQVLDRTMGFFQGVVSWMRESPEASFIIVFLVVLIMMSAVKRFKSYDDEKSK
jgi:hypothetical protein